MLQGDVLAPFLFVIVVDYVLTKSEKEHGFVYTTGSGTRSRPIPALKINDLDFADDLALLENSISAGSQQLATLSSEAIQVGLEINVTKTEYMVFNQPDDQLEQQIMLGNAALTRVQDFKYHTWCLPKSTSTIEEDKL